jgi:hypothetical protein
VGQQEAEDPSELTSGSSVNTPPSVAIAPIRAPSGWPKANMFIPAHVCVTSSCADSCREKGIY